MHRFLQVLLSCHANCVAVYWRISCPKRYRNRRRCPCQTRPVRWFREPTVVAHNVDTGVDFTSTTNGSGVYNIRFLPIGRYQVTVSATGFNSQQFPVFTLRSTRVQSSMPSCRSAALHRFTEVNGEVAPILNTNDAVAWYIALQQ